MKANVNGTSRGGVEVRWPPTHWIQSGCDYRIFDEFWKVKFGPSDKQHYERFLRMLELHEQGLNASAIGRRLEMNNVGKYLSGGQAKLSDPSTRRA